MGLKKFNANTPSLRFTELADFKDVAKKRPEKGLVKPKKSSAGRNNAGRVTVRHRGGGHKRFLRVVDFKRSKHDVPATVTAIEYDPNRSARIALLHYIDGVKSYIIAPVGLNVGMKVMSGPKAEPEVGNALPVGQIPPGLMVHNIELYPGRGGQLCRGAGMSAQIMAREGEHVHLKLPSGEIRMVLQACYATVGQVGNIEHETISLGKAGRKRWMGIRPTVRGVAMNPVDHPMGGGEGRTSGGGHPVTPWGQLTKGKKTRNPRKSSRNFIIKRRK
jgi:large subunit ribosomal protein L2